MNIELNTATILGLVSATATAIVIILVADYVLSSIGYSKLALRRNISAGWLIWIPVIRYWTIGAVADDYDSQNGIKRRFRFFLLAFQFIELAIVIPVAIYSLQLLPFYLEYGVELFTHDIQNFILLVPIIGGIVGLAFASALFKVCYTVAVYKVFESTEPRKALVFSLVGAMIPLLGSVFVFISRNKGYDYLTAYQEESEPEEDLTELVEEQ